MLSWKYASAMSKAVFSGVLEAILSPIVLVTVIFTPVTAQLDFASKEQTEETVSLLTVMNLMRRFVHASNESEQSSSGYPGGVPGGVVGSTCEAARANQHASGKSK